VASPKNEVLVDANVILRYLLKDHEEFFRKAEEIFDKAFSGKVKIEILQAVLAEVVYVLEKLYKVKREEIAGVLCELLKVKTVSIKDKDVVLQALDLYHRKNMDFIGALLCTYGKKKNVLSFDKDVQKCLKVN